MRTRHYLVAIVAATWLLGACERTSVSEPALDHNSDVLQWRSARLARLTADDGYLALVGLYWLRPGAQTFGADSTADIVFPAPAAPLLGKLTLHDEQVEFTANADAQVMHDGQQVAALRLLSDADNEPTELSYKSLTWFVVRRGNKLGVRVLDSANPVVASFPGLDYFPIEADWKKTARFRAYPEPKQLAVGTVVTGYEYDPVSPGILEFSHEGRTHSLEAYESGDRYFIVFADQSSGDTTYPAGRFLYAPVAGPDGTTTLDFNKAYNPPCAFNDFATCPIASPRNRLKIPVLAGELYSPSLHIGVAH